LATGCSKCGGVEKKTKEKLLAIPKALRNKKRCK
jgi:hypothetical protein